MTRLIILPECYVDTQVAKIIVQGKLNHQMGCSQVANKLFSEFKNSIALGIIDEDKNKGSVHPYIKEFDMKQSANNLILKKHSEREHYLIVICPEIENWLLNDAKSVNIDLSSFKLPHDLKGLIKLSKTEAIGKNPDFNRLIKALIRAQAPSITTFKLWLDLFKNDAIRTLI
jgi:hypothetical protein